MRHSVRALTVFLTVVSLACFAQSPSPGDKARQRASELKRQRIESLRKALVESGVAIPPDSQLNERPLAQYLDALPQMHEARYETKALKGVYIADTLYLPEHVDLAGDTVIVANHMVFEGKNVAVKGPFNLNLFTTYPTECLGEPLRDRLLEAGFPLLTKGAAAPVFSELVQRLNLDPYRNGKRYQQVFAPGRITIDVSGNAGHPGMNAPGIPNCIPTRRECPSDPPDWNTYPGSFGTVPDPIKH